MHKIKVFLMRLRSGSMKRMLRNVNIIHQETGKPKIFLFLDMVWCILFYGVGYLDYLVFGFANLSRSQRKTFMTMNDNIALVHRLNDPEACKVFDDKLEFNRRFRDYLGRDYLDLRQADAAALADFCRGRDTVFAKNTGTYGGQGIEKIQITDSMDYDALYAQLMERKQWSVEETLRQHEQMNRLCASSVNTVRIVTILYENQVHFLYALLRMGWGNSPVDNITSGGMYTWVDENGVLTKPAFCDKTGLYYTEHPVTHTPLSGFTIPYFQEAVELCKQAARVEPRVGYIGWDVAITPNGPVLVEGNNHAAYDMCQNARFHDDGMGIRPRVEQILGGPIQK